jgi:tripartite ATP-independent transporter DctP family solute receptor
MRQPLNAALAVMIAGAVVAEPATAQIQERTLKVGISLNEDHPQGQAVRRFGELLEKKSNGKIKVKLFAAGSLGNDATMISALRGGTQEMTVPDSSTLVGLVREFGVLNFPMAIDNEQEADALVDGPFGQMLLAKLPDKGLIGLAFWENGFRQVTNSRRPINGPADIAGLKLRVIQNPLLIDTFSALGAIALPLPFPEVYTALEQKTVDGQENPTATILLGKFYEVQKHLALTRHIYSVWVLLLSKKTWDSMSAEERRIVQEAAKEATAFERTTIREYGAKALDELKAKGMQVTELSPVQQAAMRAKLEPVVDKFSFVFGKETSKEMLDELQKMRRKK